MTFLLSKIFAALIQKSLKYKSILTEKCFVYQAKAKKVTNQPRKSKHFKILNYQLTHFNPVLHFIKKPVNWFAMLLSIWNTTPGWNKLIQHNVEEILKYSQKCFYSKFESQIQNNTIKILELYLLWIALKVLCPEQVTHHVNDF